MVPYLFPQSIIRFTTETNKCVVEKNQQIKSENPKNNKIRYFLDLKKK